MTTEDLLEKVKRYPVQFVCAAIVLACSLTFYFRMDLISEREAAFEDASSKAGRVDSNLSAGASLPDHLESMKTFVARLDTRLVRPAELAENLKYFYRIESETGVSIGDLRQSAPAGKRPEGEVFAPVVYDVMLSGGFAQVVGFLSEIENGERFARVKSFNMQRGRDLGQPSVALALNLELLGTP
ncbi:hypothetical protein ASA1KI_13000 [Opitutales bacterium ASA1]|jgi:hypothetical protein|uniref:hypothetical protein n=1 Tax=Congregicoccus parvus TaxID=3081749 RepID=UPI002B2A4B7D|nr:hypothetical protein ASA1KI_13000 [Opitutales bacterium ASA1]